MEGNMMQELQLVLSIDCNRLLDKSVSNGQALTAGCCSTCVWSPANRCYSRIRTDIMPKLATYPPSYPLLLCLKWLCSWKLNSFSTKFRQYYFRHAGAVSPLPSTFSTASNRRNKLLHLGWSQDYFLQNRIGGSKHYGIKVEEMLCLEIVTRNLIYR